MKISVFKKNKIAIILIVALCMQHISYAQFITLDDGIQRYIDDEGKFVTGWRWLDANNDGICECYRFDSDGNLATESTFKGKKINDKGQWVVNGVVQQIYKATGRPLYATNVDFAAEDTNKYLDFGTSSTAVKRINATKRDMQAMIEKDENNEGRLKTMYGPEAKFEKPKDGFMLSKSVKNIVRKRPVATRSTWLLIDDALKEEEVRQITASQSIVAGRDMRNFVTSSNKYTKKADNVKIYGGEIWDDVIVLQGNGAYVKFSTSDTKSKFKANYFTVEVAHQTHGESTADTYCAIELLINGEPITSYDEFCDGEPEIIEEWLDDSETNIQLKATVTGDAPGRKIYIRNARFRQIKEKNDE